MQQITTRATREKHNRIPSAVDILRRARQRIAAQQGNNHDQIYGPNPRILPNNLKQPAAKKFNYRHAALRFCCCGYIID